MVGLPYRRVQHIRKHLAFEFTDAGHILGSASVILRSPKAADTGWSSPATSAGRGCRSSATPIRPPTRSIP